MPTDPDAERRRILSAGGPRNFQQFRRLLSPRVRALKGYVAETVRCSAAFYVDVADALNSVADDFHHVIHTAGHRITIGDRLVNMDYGRFVGNQPRGHGVAGTWEMLNGAYVPPPVSRVYIAELINRRGAIAPAPEILPVVREELGHAIDYALGHGVGRPSHADPDFLAAYNTDRTHLTDPALRATMAYFLQSGSAGREELFAQLFVAMWPGALAPNDQAQLIAAFSRCWNVMPRILP
jgi:hypothetical protein